MIFNLKKFAIQIKEAMGGPAYRYRDQTHWSRIEDAIKGDAIAVEGEGGGKTWNQLREEIPSLEGVLYEILAFKSKNDVKFMARYGLNKDEVNEVFQVFAGFHPFYGCYLLSVGPYYADDKAWEAMDRFARGRGSDGITDEDLDAAIHSDDKNLSSAGRQVKADKGNRFSYFTKRFQRATDKEIAKSAHNYIQKKMKALSDFLPLSEVNLTEDDLELVIKKATGVFKKKTREKGQKKSDQVEEGASQGYENVVYPTISATSEIGEELFTEQPLMGTNSYVKFNAKGLAKIMSAASRTGNWSQVYEQAIANTAEENGIPLDQFRVIMESDTKFMEDILESAKAIQMHMIEAKDPAVALMKPIPNFALMGKPGRFGSQRPDALKTRSDQINLASLRTEVLETIANLGTDDPVKVTEALNASRNLPHYKYLKAKGEITPEVIKEFLARLKKERIVRGRGGKITGNKSYEQLVTESKNSLKQLIDNAGSKVNEGYTDLQTAYDQACIFLTSSLAKAKSGDEEGEEGEEGDAQDETMTMNIVDKKSKAKINYLSSPPPDLFQRGKNNKNVTTNDLNIKRQQAEAGGTEEEILKTIKPLSPKTLENEMRIQPEVPAEIEETPEEIQEPVETAPEIPGALAPQEGVAAQAPQEGVAPTAPVGEDFPVTEVPPTEVQQEIEPQQPVQQPAQQLEPVEQQAQQGIATPQAPVAPQNRRRKKAPALANTLIGNTLVSLIKIARELDSKGKYQASEEVHKVIRKYQKGI